MNRRAARSGHAHRVSDGLERQALRPGIRIRAGGAYVVNRGAGSLVVVVVLVLFPGAGGKRKCRKDDDGNPRVCGRTHRVLLPWCVAVNLPTSYLAVKGILARKSKNLTPSGIFSQFIKASLVGDHGLGISRRPLCMILA